ncbi:Cro/Cl family transcriptional regulator [Vibrio cholerae]|uniref:transcriptional regulator n=1 Tax=Vibrio cholerae TaxID=666 RepID=UPI001A198D0D|nr:Cro/Cl family transcriptional regulator [Vibrio cholerae]EGR4298023.1 Cro/Cl family transcriptional regulator [Vibrio cholerae]ELY5178931.1 helix-turn-helix domain-containing protein [Vibrio cholerae]HAS3166417.1 helix-turn-helix domain-containing protein [Vibrio cholerae]
MTELKSLLLSMPFDERECFAAQCGTSIGYLNKAMSKKQKLGPILCVRIEKFSQGKVTRKQLRKDDWQEIWPELLTTKA